MAEQIKVEIMVGDEAYALPALDTLDIDETIVFYDYTGLTFDQAFEIEGLNPKVVKALLHIAVQRKEPALRDRDVQEMVGVVNMMSVLEQLSAAAEVAPDPTQAEAPRLDEDSKPSSSESIEPSGVNGNGASESSQEKSSPVSSGVPSSDEPAVSDPRTSAA